MCVCLFACVRARTVLFIFAFKNLTQFMPMHVYTRRYDFSETSCDGCVDENGKPVDCNQCSDNEPLCDVVACMHSLQFNSTKVGSEKAHSQQRLSRVCVCVHTYLYNFFGCTFSQTLK